MTGFIITFCILVGVFLPIFFRETKKEPPRIRANLTLFYRGEEVFEPTLIRLMKSSGRLNLTVTVVDLLKTEESRRWLTCLSEKTDIYFDII